MAWSWITLLLLPMVIYSMALFVNTNLFQIQRAALAVGLLEIKIEKFLSLSGGAQYVEALAQLRNSIGCKYIGVNLSPPLTWERLLRSRKGQIVSRLWDQSWYRVGMPLWIAFAVSTVDGSLAAFLGTLGLWVFLAALGAYLAIMLVAWWILASKLAFGNWEGISKLLALDTGSTDQRDG